MNTFKQFNIKPESKAFEGEKIKVEWVLNKEIVVEAFKIEDSKYKERGNGKCLYLQIHVDNRKRVLFVGSTVLQEMIQKVKPEDFPFTTTIIKQEGRFMFS
jgi:hypothetical protein